MGNNTKKARVPEICLIAPSQSLADLTRRVAADRGLEVGIYVAVLDDGIKLAEELMSRGARIFVSRKGTAEVLARNHFTVAKISTTLNDYLRHLDLLKGYQGKTVIVEYVSFINELKQLCRYLGVENTMILGYQNATEYEQCVKMALDSHATCFMGGGASLPNEAKRQGIHYTVVENTYESVSIALDAALQLLNVQKQEREKRKEYEIQLQKHQMLMNYTRDAIINVDARGMVSIMNMEARRMFHLTHSAVGRDIRRLLPELEFDELRRTPEQVVGQIIRIQGQLLSVNKIPIVMGGQFEGAIYFFQSVHDIQKSEQRIRLQLHQKGLVAKYHFEDILGISDSLERVKLIARSYAQADSSILLTGETGTGKELFAQSIHNSSPRRNGPFVAINCAALPKDLLSSQLFGYEEGSFTGAAKGGKPGIFELAHGGTIFLDEIGEIPEETQIQLLRVLQEKEVRRLSSDKVIPIDVRVICATNRNLALEVKERRFRMDLFFRINVLKLEIPPLRERKEDIPLLADHFLEEYCRGGRLAEVRARMHGLYPRMMEYSWPGNIRELQAVTERIAILLDQGFPMEIDAHMMMEEFGYLEGEEGGTGPEPGERPGAEEQPEPDRKTEPEESASGRPISECRKEDIIRALKNHHYRKQEAAQALGISRSTLWRLIRKYEIE